MYLCLTELSYIELFICIKMDLALDDQQWLIFHKTKPTKLVVQVVMNSGYMIIPVPILWF